jgi:hypothetical protein
MKPWEKQYDTQQSLKPWEKQYASQGVIEEPVTPIVEQDSLSTDLANRGGNIKQAITQTLTGEKPMLTLPYRYAKEVGGGVMDVGGRALSAVTPDVIEEPIKEYARQAVDYIAGTKAGQLAGQGYQYAKETAPNIMDIVEGATSLTAAAPITKLGTQAITKPVVAAVDAATPNIPVGMAEVTSLAQKYDIPTSLPQVTESRALNNVQKISQELPFSGSAGFRDKQLSKWQENIFKTIGIKGDRFSPSMMNMAFKKVGGEFDDLTKNKRFNVGDTLEKRIMDIAEDADNAYSGEAMKALEKQVMPIIDSLDSQGNITGDALSFYRRKLNALARKAKDEEKKAVFQDLENAIVDSITSNDPILQAKLQQAKYNYKNLIAVEPLAVKAKKGFINPTLLNQRVAQVYGRAHTTGNSGDIGELARIGHELLGELGGSDTLQKGLYTGAALGGGYIDPLTTGSILAANRGIQSGLLRNQSLINRKVQKSLKGSE